MINEEWPLRPLGELFEIGAGKTMSAAARSGENKTPFLRTSNVLWDDIDLTTVDGMYLSPKELPEKLVRAGDLLVCEGGEIGRAAIWNGQVQRMSFQNHVHRLRPILEDVDPRFYVYFLQSGFTQLGIFEGAGNKTTIPNLSRSRLAALEVPFPGIEEQRAIVRLLSSVRQSIKVHEALLSVAEELKRAALRTLLSQGLREEASKESEVGSIPLGWNVRKLEEVADIFSSSRLSYAELLARTDQKVNGDSVAVLGIKVVDMNSCTAETFLTDAELSKDVSLVEAEHRCLRPGAIVFPKNGAAVSTNKKRRVESWCVLDPNVMALHAREIDQGYLFQWMLHFDLRSIVKPGPVPNFGKGDIAGIPIQVPPTLQEQQEIVRVLEAIDRKTDLHRRKLAATGDLFESLLYGIMTGKIKTRGLDLSTLEPVSLETAA